MKSLAVLVLVLASGLAACGGKSQTSTTPTPAGDQGSAAPAQEALPDVPFDQLSHKQKGQFMAQKVMPTMKPIFQNHDAQKFAKFECETCHGEGARQGKFDMPNGALPKLDFANMGQFDKKDIEWMENEVKPTMAKTLQMPEYTKDNPKGFGCLGCHTMAGGQ